LKNALIVEMAEV